MISIVRSLGAVLSVSLIESQAWERQQSKTSTDSRHEDLMLSKAKNYTKHADSIKGNPEGKRTLSRYSRQFYGLPKSAATFRG